MKCLIVEDDFVSCLLLQKLLEPYGECHVAVNGVEAVKAVSVAMEAQNPYDLICLDIMMPQINGQAALKEIRAMEEARGIFSTNGAKILMTAALDDLKNVSSAYSQLCDNYLVKPIEKAKLVAFLEKSQFIRAGENQEQPACR